MFLSFITKLLIKHSITLFSLHLPLSLSDLIEIPTNKVAMVGDRVTMECSVHNGRSIPCWSVTRQHQTESITEGFIVNKSFLRTHMIEREDKTISNRHYDLAIKRVTLSDAGFYTCYDSVEGYDVTASLTIITAPTCNRQPSPTPFRCSLISAGPHPIQTHWICTEQAHDVDTRVTLPYVEKCNLGVSNVENEDPFIEHTQYKETNHDDNEIDDSYEKEIVDISLNNLINDNPDKVEDNCDDSDNEYESVYEIDPVRATYITSEVSLNSTSPSCFLSIKALEKQEPTHLSNLNTDPTNFQMFLIPVAAVTLNISHNQRVMVGTTIKCSAVSFLKVTYRLTIEKMNLSHDGSMLRLPASGVFNITCTGENDLNVEKVSYIVEEVKVVRPNETKVCTIDDVNMCQPHVLQVFNSREFTRFSKSDYQKFCKLKSKFKACVRTLYPCRIPLWITASVSAFEFYCDAGFVTSYKMDIGIELKYPHLLMRKFVFMDIFDPYFYTPSQELNSHNIDERIILSYCNRIMQTAYVLAEESFAKVSRNEITAAWVRKLYSKLLGLDLEEFGSIFMLDSDESISLHNCTLFNVTSPKTVHLCEAYKNCASIHTRLLHLFHYGYVFTNTKEEMLGGFCDISAEELDNCKQVLVSGCEHNIQVLLSPLRSLQQSLCGYNYLPKFLHHQLNCYIKLHQYSPPFYNCANNFSIVVEQIYKENKEDRLTHITEICSKSKVFLECLGEHIREECHNEVATQAQMTLSRILFSFGLQDFFCSKAFQHSDLTLVFNSFCIYALKPSLLLSNILFTHCFLIKFY